MSREEVLQQLREFKEENKDRYHIQRLGIFGSVARAIAKKNSDIDVVVALTKQDLFEIIGIKQSLEERLHASIDVVSYREKMNAFLKQRIDREAIYV